MELKELAGHDLGTKRIRYERRDAILYALSVGAAPDQLDLVYERDLRVLPAYGCALGLWAVEAAGSLGAYDRKKSLHAGQELIVHAPLPPEGDFDMTGRISAVWDKGRAAIVEIEAECASFTARYSIFLPGLGGWGGDRGPASASADIEHPDWRGAFKTWENQASIYRLTGDLHPIHVDPAVSAAMGFDRPILHGLCTLGIAARMVAEAAGAHPCDMFELTARLAAPVLPGDQIVVTAQAEGADVRFETLTEATAAIKGGVARYYKRDTR